VLVRLFLSEPPAGALEPPAGAPEGHHPGRAFKAFRNAHGLAAMKQFQSELAQRLPGARRVEFLFGKEGGRHKRGMMMALDGEGRPADGDLTAVMARLRPPELETVDTLITAGIAANRAEAIRWALTRIRQRPAYAQLRERIGEIERIKTEF
jgi:hypothetical protein